jgi:hypothetical protein
MKNRKQRKVVSKPKCKVRFNFKKVMRFDIGTAYAAIVGGAKLIGYFGRRSKVKTNTVTLFVPTEYGKAMKQVHVPKAAIIQDPWAAVQNIPRQEPPKCVIFKKPSMCARRYGGQGAQHKASGIKVKPRVAHSTDTKVKVKVKSRITAKTRKATARR